eukprot:365104-Chlamydomonas_euryale.AAC.14
MCDGIAIATSSTTLASHRNYTDLEAVHRVYVAICQSIKPHEFPASPDGPDGAAAIQQAN